MLCIRIESLKIFLKLRMLNGIRFVEALLVRNQLRKELFLMDLEMGLEVLIPYELSQDQWPPSYRYYDSILMLIQDRITKDRRNYAKMKIKLGTMFEDNMGLA